MKRQVKTNNINTHDMHAEVNDDASLRVWIHALRVCGLTLFVHEIG